MCKIDDYLPLGFPPAEMPPLQRLIMLMLARMAANRRDGWSTGWSTVEAIARLTGMAPRSARKHLRELNDGGFIGSDEFAGRTIYMVQRETPSKKLSAGQHNEK